MRRLLFIVFFMLIPCVVSAAPIKSGTYELGTFTDDQFTWMKSKFDMIVNSDYSITDPSTFTGFTGSLWTTYLDISTTATLTQYMDMADWATANSVNKEEILLHAKVDYTAGISTAWQNVDQFDGFEGHNGVLLYNGSTYTDKTSVAYSGASPYTTINQTLYIGYELPFDRAVFNVRTAAVSLSGTWQYWNGATWSTLTVTDGTSGMTASGTLSFTPPSNWARTIVNSSRNKYFIRFNYTSSSTAPVINTIKGDNWTNGAANACRGWSPTDSHIVNSGELAYNPSPPAGSSAKFKYQARVATWSVNHFVFNAADKQTISGSSQDSSGAYLVFSTLRSIDAMPYTGMMYDDGTLASSWGTLTLANTDFVDKTADSINTVALAHYQYIYNGVKASLPSLIVGLNAYKKDLVKEGDFNLYEYYNYVPGSGDSGNTKLATSDHATNMCYDDYLPENNGGKDIKGLMIYADTVSNTGSTYFWDQANRGPIAALAKHLIGMNSNTIFSYYSNGGFIYGERDDFIYADATTTTLSSDLTADTTYGTKTISGDFTAVNDTTGLTIGTGETTDVIRGFTKVNNTTITTTQKIYFSHSSGETVALHHRGHFTTDTVPPISRMVRWANWFPAMATDFGTANGARNMSWALGTDYGWGSGNTNNIWSRDYTNALALLRPSGSTTGGTDYNTYSTSLSLGGTYYPLYADGTTGAGITSIQLRRGEGAILMKAPITGVPGSTSVNLSGLGGAGALGPLYSGIPAVVSLSGVGPGSGVGYLFSTGIATGTSLNFVNIIMN